MKKQLAYILLALLVCSFILVNTIQLGKADGGTKVRGIIYADTIWQKSSSPYNVTGALSIFTGVKLTIEPGVTVYLNGNYIQVNGTLSARGTVAGPISFLDGTIQFTNNSLGWNAKTQSGSIVENAFINSAGTYESSDISIIQSAPLINNVTLTAKNGAVGIRVDSGSPTISNCQISTNSKGISVSQGNITILNCYIRVTGSENAVTLYNCYNSLISNNKIEGISQYCIGIYVAGSNATICNNTIGKFTYGISFDDSEWYWVSTKPQAVVSIENNLVIDNDQYGIVCSISGNTIPGSCNRIENNTLTKNGVGLQIDSDRALIQYNNLFNNSQYDFGISTNYNVNACNNWWGTVDPVRIEDKINDYTFNFNYGNVTYQPMLPSMNKAAPSVPTFTIKVVAGTGGSFYPSGVINVTYGDSISFTITALIGFEFKSLTINGTNYGNGYYSCDDYYYSYYSSSSRGTCQFFSIAASYVVEASFTSLHSTTGITITHVGEGTVSPTDGTLTVELGSTLVLRATPAKDYAFMCWLQNGMLLSNSNPYNYTVTGANTITAVFYDPVAKDTPTPTPTATPTHTATPTATPTPTTASNPTANPATQSTQNPTINPTTQPTLTPTSNPTASQTQNTASPTPTPSVPEYSAFLLLPLLTLVFCGVVAVKLKKNANQN